jgi:YD repeat-containing protein
VYDQGVVIDDLNGDGLPDVLESCDSSQSCGAPRAVWLKNGLKADFLTTIVTEKGGSTSITYSRSSRLAGDGSQSNPSLQIAFDTVSTLVSNPGFGGTAASTTYAYQGGSYYFNGPSDRQMAGFAQSAQTNGLGFSTRSYFHQGNSSDSGNGEYNDHVSKIGKPYRSEDLDQSGNVFTRTVNKWARADYGDGRNFVKLVQTLKQVYDGDASHRDTAVGTTYSDTSGNPILREDWGEVTGSGDGSFTDIGTDSASTSWSYAASTTLSNSTLSLPAREFVVDQLGATVKDTKWYYDGLAFGGASKGNQTKEERLKSGSTYITTQRTYNSYGNILTVIDPRGSTTTYSYDAFNLYPATTTNPLGQTQASQYDYATGKVATSTDANARVFVTKYDGLGRVIEEDQPDFTTPTTLVVKTKYTYTDSTSTPSRVFRQDYLNTATTSDQYTYFDGQGRTIQTKKEAESANGFITGDTIWNAIGQVGAQSLPYFTGSSAWSSPTSTAYLFTNTTYDAVSRPLTIVNAVGTTTNAYKDWTLTVTDPMGNKKDLVKDAWGNLAQVVEYLSATSSATTTYTWNRLGKLVRLTDALGNVRNFTFDTLGRLLTSEDLHAPAHALYGTTTYTYDDAGNAIALLNPRNQTISYTYDRLNRPLTEDYTGAGGIEVSYSYDAGTNAIGRLSQSVRQGSATTSLSYNPIGLTSAEGKRVNGVTATTSTTYLRNGAVDTVTYPNNEQVWTLYNDAGDLNLVLAKKPASTTWQKVIERTTYGPNGLPTFQDYGNNTQTTWTFDPTQLYRLIRKVTVSTSTTQGVPENLSL